MKTIKNIASWLCKSWVIWGLWAAMPLWAAHEEAYEDEDGFYDDIEIGEDVDEENEGGFWAMIKPYQTLIIMVFVCNIGFVFLIRFIAKRALFQGPLSKKRSYTTSK